jgi:hypothetical protein
MNEQLKVFSAKDLETMDSIDLHLAEIIMQTNSLLINHRIKGHKMKCLAIIILKEKPTDALIEAISRAGYSTVSTTHSNHTIIEISL